MKDAGCSYEAFLEQMKVDDAFDAPLTAHGAQQAADAGARLASGSLLDKVRLVAASPLSRCLETAEAVAPRNGAFRRVALEELREISGLLLNAKRRNRCELSKLYPCWDFGLLDDEEDTLWTEAALEAKEDCAQRGYQALKCLWEVDEPEVLVVAHGGFFNFLFHLHPRVHADERLKARFGNCEVKTAVLYAEEGGDDTVFRLESVH
eukprot:TRINITY_DN47516_c0_g1_i1.p1 TRINITY_DN47516_c0_g1~~TRINITY_DN47516_c0_g1_i1.p1  ORF type:complete len:207 (+),score=53.86 TRINITY_DN47516_c0_g1_i1:342-962(+)